MSKEMKLIFENYRKGNLVSELTLFEAAGFDEDESKVFENFELAEGVMSFGASLLDGVKGVYNSIKDWTHEKIVNFVKKMGNAYADLIAKLKSKKLMKKAQARTETMAIKVLMTKKHIDLAVAIFSAIFKLAGGYVLEKLVEMPETLQKIGKILEDIQGGDFMVALKDLFGDVKDLVDIIKKAIEYSKDLGKPNVGVALGDYSEFGGLAEIFNKQIGERK